jgi:copper chaperone for superoxide dismutase
MSLTISVLPGIHKVEANLEDQLFYIEGTASPSSIVSAIESTGRDAILRGSGTSDSAGVCILETHANTVSDPVRGLARMVQVSEKHTLVDLTLRGVSPGTYHATVRETGDISRGAESTGGIWEAVKRMAGFEHARGQLGTIQVGKDGRGNAFLDRPVSIWEIIGRSMVVSKQSEGSFQRDDVDTLVGVIARSAGVWDNEKTVCSCSGKTVWEERKEQVEKGML